MTKKISPLVIVAGVILAVIIGTYVLKTQDKKSLSPAEKRREERLKNNPLAQLRQKNRDALKEIRRKWNDKMKGKSKEEVAVMKKEMQKEIRTLMTKEREEMKKQMESMRKNRNPTSKP